METTNSKEEREEGEGRGRGRSWAVSLVSWNSEARTGRGRIFTFVSHWRLWLWKTKQNIWERTIGPRNGMKLPESWAPVTWPRAPGEHEESQLRRDACHTGEGGSVLMCEEWWKKEQIQTANLNAAKETAAT